VPLVERTAGRLAKRRRDATGRLRDRGWRGCFAKALRLIRRTATGTAGIPPEDWADALPAHLADIAALLIPTRRERT
jgi:hypothetical protein